MPVMPRLYRSLEEAVPGFGPSVVSVGNFDGVHAGHRRILRRVVALAKERGCIPAAMTFDPHPARVLTPHRAPRLLSSVEERVMLVGEEGIEQVLAVPFDLDFARLSAEDFAARILVARLGVRAVVVGDNFRFGAGHAGNVQVLRELGARYGFTTEAIPPVVVRGQTVSSSLIRHLIQEGRISRAGRLLERPFTLTGSVVSGEGIGSQRTVPTLNLAAESEVLPARGVYITRTRDLASGARWPSVTNIGVRPTFGGQKLTVETHLLEGIEGAAPRHIRVEFLRRLRPERKFPGADELKAQILRDVARAQAFFRRLRRWRSG